MFYVRQSPRLTEDIENRRDRKLRDLDRKEKSGGDDKDDDRRREERRKRREKEKRRRERREDEREVGSNAKVSIYSLHSALLLSYYLPKDDQKRSRDRTRHGERRRRKK